MISPDLFYYNDIDADIRIHGNGFLQAELADGRKIHVWRNDIPRQKQSTFIHNHTSDFTSTILIGKLRNEEYSLMSTRFGMRVKKYEMWQANPREGKDTVLEKLPAGSFFIASKRIFRFSVGSSYEFPGEKDLFHATYPESYLVVTVVERHETPLDKFAKPIILVESGQEPDNEFNRYGHSGYASLLYKDVKKMLIDKWYKGYRI